MLNSNMLRDGCLVLAAIGGGITTILFGKQCYQVGKAWVASKASQPTAAPAPDPAPDPAPAPTPAPAPVQLDPATIQAIVAAFQAAQAPAKAAKQ